MKGEFMSLETAQKLAYNDKINELHNIIDSKDKIINYQALEIARLNQARLKAIELLKDDYFEDGSGNNIDKVLEILGDKENE